MDLNLIEELLNEEESVSLDFKKEQYLFVKATDQDKSELLKDILAFANAWRRTDAYILVGVKGSPGERKTVYDVTEHPDDAQLQQFVNSKTNRKIDFAYRAFPIDGVKIGIFHIPIQERPFYLKKDFGDKLKQNVVYLRRGSSTDEASPDEISRMGQTKINNFQLPKSPTDAKIEALKGFMNENLPVLVEIGQAYAAMRYEYTIEQINENFVSFKSEKHPPTAAPISRIELSYEPMLNMNLIIVKP